VDIEVTTVRGDDDIAAALSVWWASGAEATVTDDERGVRALLTRDREALLVARASDGIVGTVIAGWDGWRGSLYRLAVVPERRGQGIGRLLASEAERQLRRRGARRIDAVVIGTRDEATGFWRAIGFERQVDRVRFVKNLS
jgi:ribosomal protein S18 acetylase RimI-like enzyme